MPYGRQRRGAFGKNTVVGIDAAGAPRWVLAGWGLRPLFMSLSYIFDTLSAAEV